MPTLQDGKEAIARGNLQQARLIFEAILQENARDEEAWLELGNVLTDTEDKRICYENVLKINKNNLSAREALRNLEPRADPLVQALAPQPPPSEFEGEEEAEELEEDATLVAARPDYGAAEAEQATSTALLVAVGLALSVVVFAIGGGLVFFLISSLIAP
jgi:thioredoxin-like negative regulator of GroEL